MNKINKNEKWSTHLQHREPIANMKLILVISLVVVCHAYTPINNQSWVNFRKVKELKYENAPVNGEPNIIHAKHILIEEWISTLSTLVRKSLWDFQEQMKKYATDITE